MGVNSGKISKRKILRTRKYEKNIFLLKR